MNFKKIRFWFARKLIGNSPYISNVTFYQTVCIDINSDVHLNSVCVELGHSIKWKSEKDGTGFNFDFYKKAAGKKLPSNFNS